MFKATIKRRPNLERLIKQMKQLDKPIDRATANMVGETVVNSMKKMIASGQSPIEGFGRFPAYKAAGNKKKRGYPYSVQSKFPNKGVRPVNLKLSGDFLNALIFKVVSRTEGFGVDVGYFDPNEGIKEKGHREGKSQPKRPTIPINAERIATRIFQAAISIYKKRIRAILNSIS